MWPFTPRRDPRLRDVLHRLDDLDDEVAHLQRRFARLQGQLTGSIRYEREPAPSEALDEELDQLQLVPEPDDQDDRALGAELRFGKRA